MRTMDILITMSGLADFSSIAIRSTMQDIVLILFMHFMRRIIAGNAIILHAADFLIMDIMIIPTMVPKGYALL